MIDRYIQENRRSFITYYYYLSYYQHHGSSSWKLNHTRFLPSISFLFIIIIGYRNWNPINCHDIGCIESERLYFLRHSPNMVFSVNLVIHTTTLIYRICIYLPFRFTFIFSFAVYKCKMPIFCKKKRNNYNDIVNHIKQQ